MTIWVEAEGKLIKTTTEVVIGKRINSHEDLIKELGYDEETPFLELGWIRVYKATEENKSKYQYCVCVFRLGKPIEHILVDFGELIPLLNELDTFQYLFRITRENRYKRLQRERYLREEQEREQEKRKREFYEREESSYE